MSGQGITAYMAVGSQVDNANDAFVSYTSPRALAHFASGGLLGVPCSSSSHEFLMISQQTTFKPDANSNIFISCVCRLCRFHFHIECTYEDASASTGHDGMHMFVRSPALIPQSSLYQSPLAVVKLACLVSGCCCIVSVTVLPPRLNDLHVSALDNRVQARTRLSTLREERLQEVREEYDGAERLKCEKRIREDFDRVKGYYAMNTLLKYLNSGVTLPFDHTQKAQKRNKWFSICLASDFDDLLKSLGFMEVPSDDDVENGAWRIPRLEPAVGRTQPNTRRALWEDVAQELRILVVANNDAEPAAQKDWGPNASKIAEEFSKIATELFQARAWDLLKRVFCSEYVAAMTKVSPHKNLDADMQLLGCLPDFRPSDFVWAAKLLSQRFPSRGSEYIDAAHRCGLNRDDDALMEMVRFRSEFDFDHDIQESMESRQIREAFEYFDRKPGDGDSYDYYVAKHSTHVDANPGEKARADQNLQIVAEALGLGFGANGGSDGIMSPQQAASFFGVALDATPKILQDVVDKAISDPTTDYMKTWQALIALAKAKEDQGKAYEASEIVMMAAYFKKPAAGSGADQEHPSNPRRTPPGLHNIGNTCYLNSLLQYFFYIKTVRNLALNYEDFKLDLDESSLNARKTGGTNDAVGRDEAIVAEQFIEELRTLFLSLQTTTESAARPSQKLANTALKTTGQLLGQKQNKPPPLPARPSPSAPPPSGQDVEMVTVDAETISSVSSQTLVDENVADMESQISLIDPETVKVQDPEQKVDATGVAQFNPEMVQDASVDDMSLSEKKRFISEQLEQSDRRGTTQEDVGEIIGNIFDHLRDAIRQEGPMDAMPNLQADQVTKTFFSVLVNYTQNIDGGEEPREEVLPDRWITAFPHPKKGETRTIYEAFDQNFGFDLVEHNDGDDKQLKARYTAIRRLPPILHVCIQRSGAEKNRNPVTFYEDLYMDRYMEAPRGSPLDENRRKLWAMKVWVGELAVRSEKDAQNTVRPLENGAAESDSITANGYASGHESDSQDKASSETRADLSVLNEFASSFAASRKRKASGSLKADWVNATTTTQKRAMTKSNGLWRAASIFARETEGMGNMTEEQLREAKEAAEQYLGRLNEQKYVLHAVICHGGGTSAGHYWVWIRNFQKNVWLKFNDSTVTEDGRDSSTVVSDLNKSGDPYYLAYVRDDEKDQLIEVPGPAMPEPAASQVDIEMETIEGIAVNHQPFIDTIEAHTLAQPNAQEMHHMSVDEARPYELL